MSVTWYLHYDDENKPSGFSRNPPTDTSYIKISEAQKTEIEKDPLSFMVLDSFLCRVPRAKTSDPSEYFRQVMSTAPKVGEWYLSTGTSSILMALTGFATGKEFYIRIITDRGERTILVPLNKRQQVMDVYHSWLANNNLRETK